MNNIFGKSRFFLLSFFICALCSIPSFSACKQIDTERYTIASAANQQHAGVQTRGVDDSITQVVPKKVGGKKSKVRILAQVVGVRDGDTVDMLYHEFPIAARLAHIDAPERRSGQPFNNNSKQALSDLVFGKEIWLLSDGTYDRYGRIIGELFTQDGLNVNKEMVILGMAWHYVKYSDDASYGQLEQQARKQRIGIWSDSNPIAPWDWGRRKKSQ